MKGYVIFLIALIAGLFYYTRKKSAISGGSGSGASTANKMGGGGGGGGFFTSRTGSGVDASLIPSVVQPQSANTPTPYEATLPSDPGTSESYIYEVPQPPQTGNDPVPRSERYLVAFEPNNPFR